METLTFKTHVVRNHTWWRRAMGTEADEAPRVGDIDVRALHALLSDAGNAADEVQLVDVREEVEERIAALPGFQLMPISRCH